MLSKVNHYRHFGKFVLVGLFCTALNYSIFFVAYSIAALHYLPAAIIAYILSLKVGYQFNRLWTFKHHTSPHGYWRTFLRYAKVYLFSLVLNLGVLWLLVDQFGIHPLLADIVAIGQATVTNFAGLNLFVFRKTPVQNNAIECRDFEGAS